MQIIDVGSGPPIVLVPGIQGRWEWMKPAVDALARRCRVITFSLADEPTCGGRFDPANGFACYVEQVAEALDAAGVERAAICGVSFGGVIAAAFAARHPERVASLILVSALPPEWTPNARVRVYLRAPRLLSPLFVLNSLRLYREIAASVPGVIPGLMAAIRHGWTALTHMLSPARAARRVSLLPGRPLTGELARVAPPVLVLTGERMLDRVVPVDQTWQYLAVWPHAETATLPRTGHLGLVTRPSVFADHVVEFMERTARYANSDGTEPRSPLLPHAVRNHESSLIDRRRIG